jgi:hypothetical protein
MVTERDLKIWIERQKEAWRDLRNSGRILFSKS